MAATFRFQVVSHEAALFDGQVESVTAPGYNGYVGILAHHAPYLTALKQGDLTIRVNDNESHEFIVDGGVLEVLNNEAVLLTEKITPKSA